MTRSSTFLNDIKLIADMAHWEIEHGDHDGDVIECLSMIHVEAENIIRKLEPKLSVETSGEDIL